MQTIDRWIQPDLLPASNESKPTKSQVISALAAILNETDDVLDDIPEAKIPSAEQLAAIEARGNVWNFQTGQEEPADWPGDEPRPATIRIPIIGTLSKEGIKVWRTT